MKKEPVVKKRGRKSNAVVREEKRNEIDLKYPHQPTALQELFGRYLAMQRISPDAIAPFDEGKAWKEYTEFELSVKAGYSENSPQNAIAKRTDGVQKALQKYLVNTEDAENRVSAKALRNIDTGLDNEDEAKKFQWTSLAVKREESKAKQKAGVVIKTEVLNMANFLGVQE